MAASLAVLRQVMPPGLTIVKKGPVLTLVPKKPKKAKDPARLVAALDELEEARAVWLAYEVEFAERRKK